MGQNTLRARGVVVILKSAFAVGFHDHVELAEPQALQSGRGVEHLGVDLRAARRMLDHRYSIVRAGALDDRNVGHVSGLVAERDAESEGEQDRKTKHPEYDLGLTFKLLQPRHEDVREARPA